MTRFVDAQRLGPEWFERPYYLGPDGNPVLCFALVDAMESKEVEGTDEELEGIAPEKTRDIDLQRFVDAKSVDPLLFERGYFLAPSGSSSKAYRLLAETSPGPRKARARRRRARKSSRARRRSA